MNDKDLKNLSDVHYNWSDDVEQIGSFYYIE
jgi:hypothetical protein